MNSMLFYARIAATAVLLSLFSSAGAQAQRRIEPGYYRLPLDLPILLAGNFAEQRSNHFHSGVDIKTEQVEGKPLYAAADGYIARVNIAPYGFGRALYIAHPNGTTTVYAHMQKFTPEIEEYVAERRYAEKRHSGDFYGESTPASPRFPVTRGQFIGNAGNSGSSAGPHLHFEIRETASQRPLNVAALRVFDIKDTMRPTIARLHYVEIDTVGGVPMQSVPRAIDVQSVSAGVYKLAGAQTAELGRCGYFVLEVTDRKNDTQNTMGTYSARLKVDGDTRFAFQLDGFLFDETRYVNSFTHYGLQRGQRNEFIRMAVQANNRLPIYSSVVDRGALVLVEGELRDIEIEAEDDNGNVSRLTFKARLRGDGRVFSPDAPAGAVKLDCFRAFSHSADGAEITIPAGALYEPVYYTQSVTTAPAGGANMERHSPVYRIHDDGVPVHGTATLGISVEDVPQELRGKLCFARIAADGRHSYSAAEYAGGKVRGKIRSFGLYTVVADTLPPTITPSFADGADLRAKAEVTFALRDNFSGIASHTATLDGKWIAFEEKSSVLTHVFDPTRFTFGGGEHTLRITATDGKGNSTTLTRKFIR